MRSGRPCGPRTRLGRAAARERRPRATVTRARASSAPAGADEAPARAPRRAVPLRAGQMRQCRAPASGPTRLRRASGPAGVRNPCDQTPPFGHRQQRGGAPRFTRLRQAPPASSDNERGHRRRAGGDLRSPRSAAPSDPARNIPAGRAYANPRFCTPLCRPRFRRCAGARRTAPSGREEQSDDPRPDAAECRLFVKREVSFLAGRPRACRKIRRRRRHGIPRSRQST